MALPSQSASGSARNRYMRSRKRRGSKKPWMVLLLAVVVGLVYYAFFTGEQADVHGEQSSGETALPKQPLASNKGASSVAGERKKPRWPSATESKVAASGRKGAVKLSKAVKSTPPVPVISQTQRVAQRKVGTRRPTNQPMHKQQAQRVTPPPVKPRVAKRAGRGQAGQVKHTLQVGRPRSGLGQKLAHGMSLIDMGQLLEAREVLNGLLVDSVPRLTDAHAQLLRRELAALNSSLVFSKRIVPGDTLVATYVVKGGDVLSRVAPAYQTPYQIISYINNVKASRIRPGQPLKVIRGPFHAVVSKSDYRMDIYLHSPQGKRYYIRSFSVGLGEDESTPLGSWLVRKGSKVQNPEWANIRTGKKYERDDPSNPIGEYWIGLKGMDANTSELLAYGIHGTISPESIGTQASMGCIRLLPKDIELVYYMLYEGKSTVQIVQ